MSKEMPIEIFMPPNILKAKMGGGGGLDLGALKRAEQALEVLKDEFTDRIAADVDRLAAARDSCHAAENAEAQQAVFRAAQDLRAQGTAFDFPLVARVAGSLCRLTEDADAQLPLPLVDAHVDAIRVILRDRIKNTGNQVAAVLSAELERQVAAYLKKTPAPSIA